MAVTHHTTAATFGANVLAAEHLERRFIKNLKTKLFVVPLGVDSTLPEGAGKDVTWNEFSLPSAVTAAITNEGDDPDVQTFTTTPYTAQLEEFGGYSDMSKMLLKTAVSGTLEGIVDNLGYQAGLSMETMVIQELDNTSTSVDAGTAMTADALRQCAESLSGNDVMPHPATPGGQFYCAILSNEAAYDMLGEGTPAWFQAKDSALRESLTTPFKGTPATAGLYGCIVKISNNIQTDTTNSEHDNIVLGAEAFGVAALDTSVIQPRVIITRPEELVSAPVRNRGTAGWWILFDSILFGNTRTILLRSDIT
jgi:N4-gp56 family major capsid protein